MANGNTNTERVATGISGLDLMLTGGIPATNQVLVAGGPGAGKTMLCFEVLYHNAKQGIPSLFVTLEEDPQDVLKNVKSAFTDFTDIDELVEKKALKVTSSFVPVGSIGSDQLELISAFQKIVSSIEGSINEMHAKCVAIDSLSLLKLVSTEGDALTYRRALLGLMASLRKLNVTALLTIEMKSLERKDIEFSQEFFIFDGILVMYQSESQEKRTLNLEVVKMRRTGHSLSFAPYEITSKGFRVFTVEQDSY